MNLWEIAEGKHTRQDIFNYVAEKLLSQNCTSHTRGVCAYRDQTNLKCAVGWLIPDERYQRSMEGNNYVQLYANGMVPEPPDFKTAELIENLQTVHDLWPEIMWPEKLVALAERFCLNPAIVHKFQKKG